MALTYFKGINAVGDAQLNTIIESNIIGYIDWGFLTVGGYFNVAIPQSGAYGQEFSTLRPDHDENYTDGQVWEGARQNWVWEQEVNFQYASGVQPIQASGVVVNGLFYNSTDPVYGHTIQFPQGRVIFDNAVNLNDTVQVSHSYKQFHVASNEHPYFRELMFNSFRSDDDTFGLAASGQWNINPENRVQLPAIFVEVMGSRKYGGYQLGGGQRVTQDVFFHIFAEDSWSRNLAIDAIANQGRSTLFMFDLNKMADLGAFPLDYEGALLDGSLNYPTLTDSSGPYFFNRMFVDNVRVDNVRSTIPLFRGQVKWTVEIDIGNI